MTSSVRPPVHCRPSIILDGTPKPKFDAAFIERRFREHQEMQRQLAREGAAEIITEVVQAYEVIRERHADRQLKLREVSA